MVYRDAVSYVAASLTVNGGIDVGDVVVHPDVDDHAVVAAVVNYVVAVGARLVQPWHIVPYDLIAVLLILLITW